MPLLVALLALFATAPATSPLDGCQANFSGDDALVYRCEDGSVVMLKDFPASEDVEAGLDWIAEGFGAGGRRDRQERVIAGRTAEITWLRRTPKGTALVARLDRADGSRIVGCNFRKDRCLEVLEVVSSLVWHPGKLTLLGRPIPVPDGCVAEVGPGRTRVLCGPADFARWISVGTEDEARREAAATIELGEALWAERSVQTRRSEFPCRVAGITTTCLRLRVEEPAGELPIWYLAAAVEKDGTVFWADCGVKAAQSTASPCNLLFQE